MRALTFTLIQTPLYWEDKAANLNMLEEKILGIEEKTEVIILPEMFATGFTMNAAACAETMDGPVIAWMKKISAKKKAIVTGSLIIDPGQAAPPKHFRGVNRLVWMLPNGQYGFYDKRHLFAFAGEDKHFAAGNKRLIACVNGWKINLQICYDLRFPVWARQQSLQPDSAAEYDVLIYVANWPQNRSHAWKTLLPARAIENQCYVMGVNRVGEDGNGIYHSGNSMVVDPLGEIIYHKENEADVFTITLQKNHLTDVREKFPFGKDADGFKINNT